mmetsp:Transcript_40441/g.114514  ORF Transcript_40441/g.114514 Transcript_40441/m.114514 type:complete len:283 (+) Transcript_40441:119-967(+)|eukprot:CAMPEP_0117684228 /NCGR_PEP_ID=MMETSP0804-20121206/20953_1 /TAXON_ID=1074897 /ORGANISM="Tetraselmis astigmatica, Strain CCMP880" /LENGTH=282 /DNA_ID=CAMNT_0005495137 /DNA_START=99 /DNA_END=947 /DNA_ORIENTATION=-
MAAPAVALRGFTAIRAPLAGAPSFRSAKASPLRARVAFPVRRTPVVAARKQPDDSTETEAITAEPELRAELAAFTTTAAWLLSETAALADEGSGYSIASYSVSLGLFVMTVPGLWSLIKRAPKAKTARRTYAVDGPGKKNAVPIDDRARQIFAYFKKYNYTVVETGEVITFEGVYGANKSEAASLVTYTFISLLCCALVLSIVAPWGGNYWYGISLLSPLAGSYYMERATRTEKMQVKMVTSDDDMETDIIFQGDPEEMDRMAKELELMEKGKVLVKGILQQ